MTKLIIQIPCLNEEKALPVTLRDMPKKIDGIDEIELLVIDDGSTDDTVRIARENGVHHVVSLKQNRGLAKAFLEGLEASILRDADIIVNTDADNQYRADDIEKLVRPILAGEAEFVIGARPIETIVHFSFVKKQLQKLGSWVVRFVSGTNIPDAPCGFRAMSREAAMQLNVFNNHTYTLETIIQAGQKGINITSVPIRVNADMRPSRLVRSVPSYVFHSMNVILRIFLAYKPLKFFMILGAIPTFLSTVLMARWALLVYIFPEPGRTYMAGLILAIILMVMGLLCWMLGLIADLFAINRAMLEEIRLRVRKIEMEYLIKRGSDE